MTKHFINSLVEYYSIRADAFERSYIRSIGESLVLSVLGGASIYSGFSNKESLEFFLGVSAFFSSFGFLEVSARQFLERYECKQITSLVQ
jgi:hypothetical protein